MKKQLLLFVFSLAFVLLFVAPTVASADSGPLIHRVKRGETLSGIALKYGTTVRQLMRLNNLRNANRIYSGQRLVIRPGTTSTGSNIHVVRRGDTLSAIALHYGASVAAIQRMNGLRNTIIYVGQRLKVPTSGKGSSGGTASKNPVIHVVRRGETLSYIAQRYGVSVSQIVKLNGIKNRSLIRTGQRLIISGDPAKVKKQPPKGQKKIVVDISSQKCWRYQGKKLLNTWRCSTGRRNSTAVGTFHVQSKLRKAYGSTWNIWMPWWLGIYWAGPVENGIHGLPWNATNGRRTWAGLVGTPITYGCVMLEDDAAKTLWQWADIGTTVVIKR